MAAGGLRERILAENAPHYHFVLPDAMQLEYASSSEPRPIGWIVRRYPWWVVVCYAIELVAEVICDTDHTYDKTLDLGRALAQTATISAAGLFGIGFIALCLQRASRRWERVWIACLASGLLASLIVFSPNTAHLLPEWHG